MDMTGINPIYRSKVIFHSALVFLFGTLFHLFNYAGLPYDFTYDMVIHTTAFQHMTYDVLWRYALNPLTPAWFFLTEMGYLRPIYYMIHRFFFDHFGAQFFPLMLAVALGLGALGATFFNFAVRITRSFILAWLFVIFYATIPTNPSMAGTYLALDLQYWMSLFNFGALGCLMLITWKKDWPYGRKIMITAGWILLTWICIKWKSSEKLLPFVYLASLLVFCRSIYERTGKKFFAVLLLLNVLMFILVVPLKKFDAPKMDYGKVEHAKAANIYTEKDERMFTAGWSQLKGRIFFQDRESNPFIRFGMSSMPKSLSGDFGLLSWLFWLGLLIAPFFLRRMRSSPTHGAPDFPPELQHAAKITAVWFAVMAASAASGAPLSEVRYINFALVPAIILLMFIIRMGDVLLNVRPALKKAAGVILIFLFSVTILQNLGFLIKHNGHFGGMQYALFETERIIYRDAEGSSGTDLEVHLFHDELVQDGRAYFGWHDMPADWLKRLQEKVSETGSVYLRVHTEDDRMLQAVRESGFPAIPLGKVSLKDAPPPLFALYRMLGCLGIKSSKEKDIFAYRVEKSPEA